MEPQTFQIGGSFCSWNKENYYFNAWNKYVKSLNNSASLIQIQIFFFLWDNCQYTSHSAYAAMSTELDCVKIDGFLYSNFIPPQSLIRNAKSPFFPLKEDFLMLKGCFFITKEGWWHSIASSLFPTSLYLHSNSTRIWALKKIVFKKKSSPKKIFFLFFFTFFLCNQTRHLFCYLWTFKVLAFWD